MSSVALTFIKYDYNQIMAKRIKTNVKFVLSERDGSPIGYVTKVNGAWKGCRDNDQCKKKIVLVDKELGKRIVPNCLYRVIIIPMTHNDGFVTIQAEIVKFAATVTTSTEGDSPTVSVTFGNKTLVYDPSSCDRSRSDISCVIKTLSQRMDIKDVDGVIADFVDSAELVRRTYIDTYQPLCKG